jgi:predicted transglutaminase-like cysteine proteinase
VITKRSRLIGMGLPAGALRIAYAKTSSGEGHAVLIVKTNKGDYVLDNRTSSIRPKSQSGLRFISISTANPKKWVAA